MGNYVLTETYGKSRSDWNLREITFWLKPTGNHVLTNECDSRTNYLRQPRYHCICCLGLLQNTAHIYTQVTHHPSRHHNNVAITYQQYQKVQVYMVHLQSWLWQHNCQTPRTTGVQHLKANFIKSIIRTAFFWHVMQCSWWIWDSIYQTTWHHIPDENIFIITTIKR